MMSSCDKRRYYWLRLKENFFDQHEIRILEKMQDGNEIVLFYIRLLVEGIKHEGELRFSADVPYDAGMLAAITNVSEDKANKFISALHKLGLIFLDDEGTYCLPQTMEMLGVETEMAERKRRWRAKVASTKNGTTTGQEEDNVPRMSRGSPENVTESIEYRDYSIDNSHTAPAPACTHAHKEPPSFDTVLGVAKNAAMQSSGKQIPETFVKEWYDLMTLGGWKDSRGRDVLLNWKLKLAYAWKDQKNEMARLRERAVASGNHVGGVYASQSSNKIGLED